MLCEFVSGICNESWYACWEQVLHLFIPPFVAVIIVSEAVLLYSKNDVLS